MTPTSTPDSGHPGIRAGLGAHQTAASHCYTRRGQNWSEPKTQVKHGGNSQFIALEATKVGAGKEKREEEAGTCSSLDSKSLGFGLRLSEEAAHGLATQSHGLLEHPVR